jgi:UDP-3-O-[3-hydroxymyristoyl] glucosamine N-acyltransferase
MKLREIAKIIPGQLVGDGNVNLKNVAEIKEAKSGDLVFVLEPKLLASALSSPASAVIASNQADLKGKPGLLVNNPRGAMARILAFFAPKKKSFKGIHKSAVIAKSARLGKRLTIYPFVYIGENCLIGDDTTIYPHVTLYDGTVVGKRVILHSGCRLGIDGFGYIQENGRHLKIPQIGNVIIEDDVELYANVCVSRATLGSTVIGAGTKIDNLSHVAHNCKIGRDCAIVSLVGFAGSVSLGDRVQVGGQSGFAGHVTIGDDTAILARSGVTKSWPARSVISGFPAIGHQEDLKQIALLHQLPKTIKRFKLPQ